MTCSPSPAPTLSDADDAVERREATVPAALHRARLDKAVVAAAPEFSRSHLQALIEAGHVALDGQVRRTSSHKVQAGQIGRASCRERVSVVV